MSENCEKGTAPIRITADASESRSGIIGRLQRMPGFEVQLKAMECGDYLVGTGVIVERKCNTDFFASILDGRFIEQVERMSEMYDRIVYLIEGDLLKTQHNFQEPAIHGALSYLAVLQGASVILSADVASTASIVATMARHCQQGLGYIPPLRVGKPKAGTTAKRFIIEGLPGVGPKKASDILAYFGGRVDRVFTASKEDWLKMPGMGKAGVDKIFEVLHS